MLAIIDKGEEYIFSKVGMEPSGDPFNSIKKLETSTMKKPAKHLATIALFLARNGKNSKNFNVHLWSV